MPAKSKKQSVEVVEVPLDEARKKRVQRAAKLRGTSTSKFLLSCVDETTARVLGDGSVWELTQEESKRFVELLINPPAPTPALRRAAKLYTEWEKSQHARSKLGS
jgi:uncharacterized protein (DUF1778 family)